MHKFIIKFSCPNCGNTELDTRHGDLATIIKTARMPCRNCNCYMYIRNSDNVYLCGDARNPVGRFVINCDFSAIEARTLAYVRDMERRKQDLVNAYMSYRTAPAELVKPLDAKTIEVAKQLLDKQLKHKFCYGGMIPQYDSMIHRLYKDLWNPLNSPGSGHVLVKPHIYWDESSSNSINSIDALKYAVASIDAMKKDDYVLGRGKLFVGSYPPLECEGIVLKQLKSRTPLTFTLNELNLDNLATAFNVGSAAGKKLSDEFKKMSENIEKEVSKMTSFYGDKEAKSGVVGVVAKLALASMKDKLMKEKEALSNEYKFNVTAEELVDISEIGRSDLSRKNYCVHVRTHGTKNPKVNYVLVHSSIVTKAQATIWNEDIFTPASVVAHYDWGMAIDINAMIVATIRKEPACVQDVMQWVSDVVKASCKSSGLTTRINGKPISISVKPKLID